MKIAILTQPLGRNYGGILQNYALQQTLIKLGHSPITLEKDYRQRISVLRLILELPKRIYTKYILKKREYVFSEKKYNGITFESKKLLPFVAKYINHNYIKDYSLKIFFEYDAIVVGSDQTWRPKYNVDNLYNMFLPFIPGDANIKRIAYATSFGTSEWEYNEEQTNVCSKLMKNFNAVSTREIDGIDLCHKFLKRDDVINVLDPTLLLEKEDYISICRQAPKSEDKFLLAYILDNDNNIIDSLEKIAKEKELTLKIISAHDNCVHPVEEWLAMFRDAQMVITDSFHGTVFAIMFNKEFYSICNKSRGNSRFNSLLSQLNIQERLINNIDSVNYNPDKIDWNKVEKVKSELKNISIQFLCENL